MDKELLEYFNGDELAASVWKGKYALPSEITPADMHKRMAKEFARVDFENLKKDEVKEELSTYGKSLLVRLKRLTLIELEDFYFEMMDRFGKIVPQGSVMAGLGNYAKIQSLSNCFVVPAPYDSYGGIFKTDQEIAQLEKRRGGVGTNMNTLAPEGRPVLNSAGSSTGSHSFMPRFSNTTREVAQNGRRGALMLLMSCLHPDIFKFVTKKKDRTQVTGANVSIQFTDKFMEAVSSYNDDFICRFPIDIEIVDGSTDGMEYNKLYTNPMNDKVSFMKIHAKELFDLVVEMAWDNAEPGVAFMDRVWEYSPDGVYEMYKAIASNPCGEQWIPAYDSCRLILINLLSFIRNAFTSNAEVDYTDLYETAYIMQRMADLIVDLEIECVDRILAKIEKDPEPPEVKAVEKNLWTNVRKIAQDGRRTGCGFTALGDMVGSLGFAYDSKEALDVIEKVSKTKMEGELDATIDLAILRGAFEGWNKSLEFFADEDGYNNIPTHGNNDFYRMLLKEFPNQALKMYKFGRRNVSWSTVAPTGSVSILTQTTSGIEPLFLAWYMRRKKVNPSDKNARVDFVDQNGDSWQEYPVVHPKFREWYYMHPLKKEDGYARVVKYEGIPVDYEYEIIAIEDLTKEQLESVFKESPWYKSCANDIDWEKRIEVQAMVQKYTTNAISSTMNLPENVSKETVDKIYRTAWSKGLKGITIYRDNCRTGVLVAETPKKAIINEFGYTDAPKRPKELDAQMHVVSVKGQKYGVAVGFLNDQPYEVFAFKATDEIKSVKGRIVKVKKGHYDFLDGDFDVKNLQTAALHADEQVLTRLVSGMLRHGMNPYFIISQIDKTPLEVISFGKALTRVLKTYIKEQELKGKLKCADCGSHDVRLQEGCLTCMSCGSSKCG
jgi:ribonucleoside-diphosphate reductase alpha chain